MVTVEQATAMNQALLTAQQHITNLSTEIDKLKIGHDMDLATAKEDHEARLAAVRQEASDAVLEMRQRINDLETARGGGHREPRVTSLINLKKFEPKTFEGKMSDNIKPWAKSIRNYCNACRPGFRVALEWAELQATTVTVNELNAMNWNEALEANIELYDYLQTVTSGEALLLVEKYPQQGFEAWRQLHLRSNPQGGRFQLNSLINLMNRKQCQSLAELPAAADRLEKEIREYETRSTDKFPEEMKLPLPAQMLRPQGARGGREEVWPRRARLPESHGRDRELLRGAAGRGEWKRRTHSDGSRFTGQ